MPITFDPKKRELTLVHRQLDFDDADQLIFGNHVTVEDDRRECGGIRLFTVGRLNVRMVVVVWTPGGADRRIISMRRRTTVSSDDTASAWIDQDDAPDLSAPEWQAKVDTAPVIRSRGRPRSDSPKALTSLRLSTRVLDAFKATGPGWQTRIDAALWDAVDRHASDKTAGAADSFRQALDLVIERRKRHA